MASILFCSLEKHDNKIYPICENCALRNPMFYRIAHITIGVWKYHKILTESVYLYQFAFIISVAQISSLTFFLIHHIFFLIRYQVTCANFLNFRHFQQTSTMALRFLGVFGMRAAQKPNNYIGLTSTNMLKPSPFPMIQVKSLTSYKFSCASQLSIFINFDDSFIVIIRSR